MNEIPEKLRKHRQLEDASCAVSAFECIAKLEDLIDPNDFPLQSDPANQKKGFGDTRFLESHGLKTSQPSNLTISDAVDLIGEETKAGRFPLVSQIVGRNVSGEYYAHIYVCALHKGALLLIDPAIPKVQARNKEGIEKELQEKVQQYPIRKTIHVLVYSK